LVDADFYSSQGFTVSHIWVVVVTTTYISASAFVANNSIFLLHNNFAFSMFSQFLIFPFLVRGASCATSAYLAYLLGYVPICGQLMLVVGKSTKCDGRYK